MYSLTWNDIFNGMINGKSSRQLTADEILDILETIKADSEKEMNAFKHALTFLDKIDKARGFHDDKVRERYMDKLELMSATLIRKKCLCSRESIQFYNTLFTKESTYAKQMSSAFKSCNRTYSMNNCKHLKTMAPAHEGVSLKCSSLHMEAELKSPIIKTHSKLRSRVFHCKLARINKSALMLNPIKVEILENNPRIAVLHDIVRVDNDTLDTIRKIFKHRKSASRGDLTQNIYTEDGAVISLDDKDKETIKSYKLLEQNILALSGTETVIDVRSQVFNYGLGGYTEVIKENGFTQLRETDLGRKCIFSVVFQLTNVSDGGLEVFPELGITVKLEKGSALLYENKFRNGSKYAYSRHCNCPVLYGKKWTIKMCIS